MNDFKIKDNTWSSFFLIFVYFFLVSGLVMLIWMLPIFNPNKHLILFLVVLLLGLVVVMTLPFQLGISRMKIWAEPEQKFKGKEEAIKELKKINSENYPFELVENNKYDLLLQFKLTDAKWKGILFRGGFNKSYWLYLKFNEKEKTVYCAEKTREISWKGSLTTSLSANAKFGFFYGIILMDKKKVIIMDPFQLFKKVADFKYSVTEAKWPIFKKLIEMGWTIKPKVFPIQVRK